MLITGATIQQIRDLSRNPKTNAFWGQKCVIKVNSAAKKEKRKMFFCHWQKNMANYIGVNAGKARKQLKMQWLREVAKIKAEQGEGLIHPVLPLIPSRCDGWLQSPTGPSITDSTRQCRLLLQPCLFPTRLNLLWRQEPLGIVFSMINPEGHIQGSSGRD